MGQVIEHLPSKYEALSSNSSTTTKKKLEFLTKALVGEEAKMSSRKVIEQDSVTHARDLW
jgi:hypothetical protein